MSNTECQAQASQAARKWEEDTSVMHDPTDALRAAQPQPPKVFLLDDDPIFCKLMEKIAKKNGIPLTVCSRLEDFGSLDSHRDFDVAVIDYYLEDLTGPQIVCLLDDKPVVMVSRSESCVEEDASWPESIKKFVPKKQGPLAILEAAISLSRPTTPEPTTEEQ